MQFVSFAFAQQFFDHIRQKIHVPVRVLILRFSFDQRFELFGVVILLGANDDFGEPIAEARPIVTDLHDAALVWHSEAVDLLDVRQEVEERFS